MKNKLIIPLLLCLAYSFTAYAGEHRDRNSSKVVPYSGPRASIEQIFMQGNNINTTFRSDGIFNYDWITFTTKESGMIWPVTSNSRKTVNYTSGLWVGAKVNGEIRTAIAAFASHFTPGNIPVLGQVTPQSVCNDPRFRIYYVQLTDPTLVNGGLKSKLAGGRTYSFEFDSWASWPVDLGAPYVEVNGVQGYQPGIGGDRPGIGNSEAIPDEISFMIYQDYTNCTNNIHTSEISLPGGSLPMGCEVQQIAFFFNSPGLTDMYFVKWKIINRSSNSWDSTYVSVFDDADVGDDACGAGDDAVGCDTTQDVGYVYNADDLDCNHGAAPPAVGYRYLQSPLVFTGDPNNIVILPYDTLIGYIALGLTGFNYFINGNPDQCLNDPDNFTEGYNFMKGLDGCGRTKLNPFTQQPTLFSYDGNACQRGGNLPSNWFDSLSHDVRFMQNSGPFTMSSGDTQTVVIGCFVGKGSNNVQSLCVLLNNAARVQRIYNLNFRSIPLPPPPQVKAVADGDGRVTLYWSDISESYRTFDVIDLRGFWNFQGYEVYQIKPGTGGENESDRKLLAIYDLVDSITTVMDTLEILQPNGSVIKEVRPTATGTNSGLSRHIALSQNAFPSGVNNFFINGQSYKFAVVAYGVNTIALAPAKVLKNVISSQIIEVVPNYAPLGTEFVNKNLDTLVTDRIDRGFVPIVIDPKRVISATYKQIFKTDSTYTILRIINNSEIDTIVKNSGNRFLLNNDAFIVDGILFKSDTISRSITGVIRDPGPSSQTSAKGWTYSGSNLNFKGVDTTGLRTAYPTGSYREMQSLSMGLSWASGKNFKDGFTSKIDSTSFLKTYGLKRVKITFGQTQKAYRYRGAVNNSPYQDYVDVPFKVEIDDPLDTNSNVPRQLNIAFFDGDSSGTWNPKASAYGGLEMLYIFYSTYDPSPLTFYTTKNINFATQFRNTDCMYIWWPALINNGPAFQNGDVLTIVPYTKYRFQQSPGTTTVTTASTLAPTIGSIELAASRKELERVRVVPNPYYGGHAQEIGPFDRFIKFMNMPKEANIYIYSLNGNLVRLIRKNDNTTTINWDLLNTDRIPVASGIYIAFIEAPGIGTLTVKLAIFTPEERLDAF